MRDPSWGLVDDQNTFNLANITLPVKNKRFKDNLMVHSNDEFVASSKLRSWNWWRW